MPQKKQLEEGDQAPDFTIADDGGARVSLSDFRGQTVVLYFYPKDDTPGCTSEACGFRDSIKAFETIGARVLGLSKDGIEKHRKFKEKYDLNFPLLSDEDGAVCEAYGTWVEKSMYGRKYMGIDRATFLIDEAGVIRKIWRKVKVTGHVDAVRKEIEQMKKAA